MNMARTPLGLTRDTGVPALNDRLLGLEQYPFAVILRRVSRLRTENGQPPLTPAEKAAMELKAKRFFSLILLDPDQPHVPDVEIDEVWHAMVLNTPWYRTFCHAIFGAFIDHTPPDDDDVDVDQDAFARTEKAMDSLYLQALGRPSVMPPPPPPKQDAIDRVLPSPEFRYSLEADLGPPA